MPQITRRCESERVEEVQRGHMLALRQWREVCVQQALRGLAPSPGRGGAMCLRRRADPVGDGLFFAPGPTCWRQVPQVVKAAPKAKAA
jgi:hypothetical protein